MLLRTIAMTSFPLTKYCGKHLFKSLHLYIFSQFLLVLTNTTRHVSKSQIRSQWNRSREWFDGECCVTRKNTRAMMHCIKFRVSNGSRDWTNPMRIKSKPWPWGGVKWTAYHPLVQIFVTFRLNQPFTSYAYLPYGRGKMYIYVRLNVYCSCPR